jgi:hypothetical protein
LKPLRRWRRSISLTLSLAILATSVPSSGEAPATTKLLPDGPFTQEQRNRAYENLMPGNKEWKELVNSPAQPIPWQNVPATDPSLDDDPFFLHGQRWIPASNDEKPQDGRIVLQLDDAKQALEIDQNFEMILETEDYVFMKAKSLEMFTQKSPKGEAPTEGLFYVDKRDMQVEALRGKAAQHPVPVMFIALESQNWTGKVAALEIGEDLPVATFSNGNKPDSMTIPIAMVDSHSKTSHDLLRTLILLQMYHEPMMVRDAVMAFVSGQTNDIELPNIFPARGSTTFFGTFPTGQDIDHPERNIFNPQKSASWSSFLLPEAQALDQSTIDLGIRLGSVAIVMSVVARVAWQASLGKLSLALNNRIDEIRKWRADNRLTKPGRQEGRWEYWNIFSYTIPLPLTVATAAFSYGAQWLTDRLFTPNKSFHRKARWFLENFLIKAMLRFENLPLGPKPLWLGSVVKGGTDTANMVLQFLVLTPWLFPAMADSNIGWTVMIAELFRSLAVYAVNGGSQYASNMAQGIAAQAEPEIERQLRNRGVNPFSKDGNEEKMAILNQRVDKELQARGFSSSHDRLYSGPSLVRGAVGGAFGYGTKRRDLLGSSRDLTEEEKMNPPLLVPGREGIIPYVYKRAREKALAMAVATGDPLNNLAAQKLEDQGKSFMMFKESAKLLNQEKERRQEVIAQGREERAKLGDYKREVRKVDGKYKSGNFGTRSALELNVYDNPNTEQAAEELASFYWKQTYLAILDKTEEALMPNEEQAAPFFDEALVEAQKQLKEKNPNLHYADSDARFLAVEIVREKLDQKQAAEAMAIFDPTKERGWYERMQIAKSQRKAKLNVAKAMRDQLPNAPAEVLQDDVLLQNPQAAELYRQEYRKELQKRVGVHTPSDDAPVMQATFEKAEAHVQDLLENPSTKTYMEKLSDEEKILYITHEYGNAFLESYTSNTTFNTNYVKLDGPEQPGRFQWLRQAGIFNAKNWASKLLRGSVRFIESPVDSQAHRLGFKNFLYRNVPFVSDFVKSMNSKKAVSLNEMLVQYPVYYVGFGAHLPWILATFFIVAISPLFYMINFFLDRMFMNIGIPPMSKTIPKMLFTFPYSYLTWPAYFPYFLGSGPVKNGWDAFWSSPMDHVGQAIDVCQKILGM